MKNYSKYMEKIDAMLAEEKGRKKPTASGLLAPSRMPKETKQKNDLDSQIANYISIIRKQKEDLLNENR